MYLIVIFVELSIKDQWKGNKRIKILSPLTWMRRRKETANQNVIYIRPGKKVWIFEPLFVCYPFWVKFLPSSLHCHAHFNVCKCNACAIYIYLLSIMYACSIKVEAVLLAAFSHFSVQRSWIQVETAIGTRLVLIIQQ